MLERGGTSAVAIPGSVRLRRAFEVSTQRVGREHMQEGRLFQEVDWEVNRAKDEGYHAYFDWLGRKLEYVTKVVIAGALAFPADQDRRRSIEREIVRYGTWSNALQDILRSRPIDEAQEFRNDFNENERPPGWRHEAVRRLVSAGIRVGVKDRELKSVQLWRFFELAVQFRNRARGHGAPTHDQMSLACPELARSLDLLTANLRLFGLPWAYLQRQLDGTFRASPLLGDASAFSYLRATPADLQSGVYVFLGGPIRLNLVHSDTSLRDIHLPNGNYKAEDGTFEWLSYISNTTRRGAISVDRVDRSAGVQHPSTTARSHEQGDAIAEPREDRAFDSRDGPVVALPQRSPAVRDQRLRTATTLPIHLDPPGAAFKEELLRTKEAWRTNFYENGEVQVKRWHASKMSVGSDVLHNLHSRPEYRSPRWRELGIVAVQVTIDPVAALGPERVERDRGWFDLPAAFDRYVRSDASVKLRIGEHGVADAATRSVGGRYGYLCVDGGGALREWFANTGTPRATLIVRVEARDLLALDWVHRRDDPRATPNLVLMSSD